VWGRLAVGALGVLLIVLGLFDYHVQVGAIALGLVLLGVPIATEISRVLRAARGMNGGGNGH
jgi:hypothetical protein